VGVVVQVRDSTRALLDQEGIDAQEKEQLHVSDIARTDL
jgi:hypothetical protein